MLRPSKPELRSLAIEQLTPGRYQPRRQFDPEPMEELAQSIKTNGLIQPIVVRPLVAEQYEIIAGERRWRAAQIAGLTTVMCLIRHYSDVQAAEIATVENINRVNLNPIEEAQAYQRLSDEFGYHHDEIAAAVGRSRAAITNALRLLKLDTRVQELLITNQLSEGHGKILAGLTFEKQFHFAQQIIIKAWSVRQLEQELKKDSAPTAATKAQKENADIKALEMALSDHVGCKVAIGYTEGKGQLVIDFHNLDILEGLFQKLGFHKDTA